MQRSAKSTPDTTARYVLVNGYVQEPAYTHLGYFVLNFAGHSSFSCNGGFSDVVA